MRAPGLPAMPGQHLALAARDHHVGDALGDGAALADGEEMLLALHHRAFDQRVLVDAFGMRQHRPGHLDGVVIGKAVDDFLRRVRDRRQLRRRA